MRTEPPIASPKKTETISFDQKFFREGMRVSCLSDDYQKALFLGDMGFITSVRPDLLELTSDFYGNLHSHSLSELRDISPAFALPASEAYGARAPAVVLVLPKGADRVMNRSLLYASALRAQSLLVIIGLPAAYAGVLKNIEELKAP
jgi:exodeoxyribonuclease V alpha subunit